MKPIAIFYHCLLFHPAIRTQWRLLDIVSSQMDALERSGLPSAASEIVIGINGGPQSEQFAAAVLPSVRLVYHPPESQSENLTILEVERFAKAHPGWNVLYFHSKGASHGGYQAWRECMMRCCIENWHCCSSDLEKGYESVGVHWLHGLDETQNYWAGNFWWATSDFLRTLPSIAGRKAVKEHGIGSREARYEAEVWIGNGPRLPKRIDYHPGHPHRLHP